MTKREGEGCGCYHAAACPSVNTIEVFQGGGVLRQSGARAFCSQARSKHAAIPAAVEAEHRGLSPSA
jgi:hypothetical protein